MGISKNSKLLILFLLGVIANIAFMWYGDKSPQGNSVDPLKFTLVDTVGISKIVLTKFGGKSVTLEKAEQGWKVNQRHNMNDQMRVLMLAVLSSLETKRKVSSTDENSLTKRLKEEGVLVEVYRQDQAAMRFITGGNTTKTVSYMMDQEEAIPHVVTIPGYSSFVAGLFALDEGDWRQKEIFKSTRNSFKSLRLVVERTKTTPLDVVTKGQFFEVKGIQQVDTNSLYDYLQQTINLQVDEYIAKGNFQDYDSLAKLEPEYSLYLEDYNASLNRSVAIYPIIPGDHQQLIMITPGNIMATLRKKKVASLMRDNASFTNKE